MTIDTDAHVIDDDAAVRESTDFLLRSAGLTVKTYDSAAAFLDALPTIGSGCIITDVRMPGISGIDLLRRLKEMQVQLPVIVITGHGDVPLAVEAMKSGAVDFLEKPFDDDVLLASVRTALNRSEASAALETERAEIRARIAGLTHRERDVLNGLIAGHPNKIIAYDLQISPRTVEIYRANVMTKMKAGSLSELVRMALVAGTMTSAPDR
jgi:two-component system response regulator FixJ